MKKLFFAMLALVALASCSKDEVVQLNQDEIKFSVVTENTTKAADVYCNNKLFTKFNVIASYTEAGTTKTYIDKDEIEYQNSAWTNNTATRFWPSTEDCLDFYAYVNAGSSISAPNWSDQNAPKVTFNTNKQDVTKHVDFVYAVTTDKDKNDDKVSLNFRHALSQIVFKAKNNNPRLHMVVTGVEIHNVKSEGTFTFPTNSTTTQYVDHGTPVNTPEATIDVQGTWNDLKGPEDYVAKQLDVAVSGNSQVVNLTDISTTDEDGDDKDKTYNYSSSMLLIPQEGSDWNIAQGVNYTDETTTGVFFVLQCKIYNVAGAQFNSNTDVLLHGKNDSGTINSAPVYLPLKNFKWNQGKKYTYTFVLDNGDITGGDDNEGDDILKSIKYEVTVDDFKYGGASDVKMDDVKMDDVKMDDVKQD